jgi:hypothetical protein
MKDLITVPLNELRTSDVEGLGQTVERDGVIYRWVKNDATLTALVASGCCVRVVTSVAANAKTRVHPMDCGPATGSIYCPAGSPVTGIGYSGSSTGDHGWIAVKGFQQVYVQHLVSVDTFLPGAVCVATADLPATQPWGPPKVAYSDGFSITSKAVINKAVATTGIATAALCCVYLDCL